VPPLPRKPVDPATGRPSPDPETRDFRPAQPGSRTAPRPADGDRRIRDLEKKLDDVLRQLEEMRKSMPGRRPSGRSTEPRTGDRDTTPRDRAPENVDPRGRSRIEIELDRPTKR